MELFLISNRKTWTNHHFSLKRARSRPSLFFIWIRLTKSWLYTHWGRRVPDAWICSNESWASLRVGWGEWSLPRIDEGGRVARRSSWRMNCGKTWGVSCLDNLQKQNERKWRDKATSNQIDQTYGTVSDGGCIGCCMYYGLLARPPPNSGHLATKKIDFGA